MRNLYNNMVTKKDYEKAREVWAARIINIECELHAAKAGYDFVEKKFSEFPDDDPMPEEVKDIVKEVTK